MKKIFIGITTLLILLSACAPNAQATQQPLLHDDSYPNPSYPSYPADQVDGFTPAQRAAIAVLSSILNLPPDQVTLISTESVDWPDGCLGVQRVGMMCTQAIVSGYKIILEANSQSYEIHTNESGSSALLAPAVSDSSTLEQVLINQLSTNLGLDVKKIAVASVTNMEFGDSCLGVAMQDVMCAQIITAGSIVVLEADGVQYEYHASNDGTLIQPATLALTWKREGGIAGFCDSLTIFRSGEIYGNQCKSQPNGTMGSLMVTLSKDEFDQFNSWMNELGQVTVDASNPKDVADRMVVQLSFRGLGNGVAFEDQDQQALLEWAQAVFQKLYS